MGLEVLDGSFQPITGTVPPSAPDQEPDDDDASSYSSDSSSDLSEIGDNEIDNPHPTQMQASSRQKQQQKAIWQAFADKYAQDMDQDDYAPNEYANPKEAEEKLESLMRILENSESRKIVDPRSYQMELFDRAKSENTIAVLDTGTGKTLIAVLLLRQIIEQELDSRDRGMHRRVAFFLVDKTTLVFQQLKALRDNLNFSILHVCGATGGDLWSRVTWQEHLEKHEIIVCTADVLLHCLHRYLKMEQISLLIFDEAHHAKGNHPYSKIMSDFYYEEPDVSKRPRIFSMTASPVDATGDEEELYEMASDLEYILDSKIATVAGSTISDHVFRPKEEIIEYDRPLCRLVTPLHKQMITEFDHLYFFDQLSRNAKQICDDLGAWCSDLYWSFAFSDREAKKREAKAERSFGKAKTQVALNLIDREIQECGNAHAVVKAYDFGVPTADLSHISPKVRKLHQYLSAYYERPTTARCLVFVERRYSARLLAMLFQHIGSEHMKTGELIGSGNQSYDGLHSSFKEQALTLLKFKKGELNCLFATSVAEEGLDVPECNLVVRFDPCKTMIQYVQSRGRARHRNSKYVHIVEAGNEDHTELLEDIHESERHMRKFCEQLPEDRHMLGSQELDLQELKDKQFRYKTDADTGARLTYQLSPIILQNYVESLPREDGDDMTLNYAVYPRQGKYICEVTLPTRSDTPHHVTGRAYKRKAAAKMSAAFEACLMLQRHRQLDSYFLSTMKRRRDNIMKNARLALKLKASKAYEIQKKPEIWADGRGTVPQELYMTLIYVDGAWERQVQSVGLLTRSELPDFPTFPIYRVDGKSCDVVTVSLRQSMQADFQHLQQLTVFMLKVYKDLFNKTFEHDESKMSYWVAPLLDLPLNVQKDMHDIFELIDWTTISQVCNNERFQWQEDTEPHSILENKFLVDPFDGGRRLFTFELRPDMKPNDPVPGNVAGGPKSAETIVEYSSSLFKKSKSRRRWFQNQPVVRAEQVLHRLNILADSQVSEQKKVTRTFVCPEPLDISQIPPPVAAMCYIFPGIIHRIESYLIALEMCDKVGICVPAALALEALTKDSDNTDDTRGDKVKFQRGMGPNYERLEFIGDTFLKMATSIALYVQESQFDEQSMHIDRMTMLCNKNLLDNARRHGYPKYIRGKQFERRTWYPEGLKLLQGKGADKQGEISSQSVAEKTIADVCEAMIGAALVSHVRTGLEDRSSFDDAVKAVTAFVHRDNLKKHSMTSWTDYSKAYSIPKYQLAEVAAHDRLKVSQVFERHSYQFRYPKLLLSAFTHPALPSVHATAPDYQRLEFLGDSLLDLSAVMHLYHSHPKKDPQWLTEHKMAMVSNKFQGALCVKLGFHRFLKHNSSTIEGAVRAFVTELEDAEASARGSRDFWMNVKTPPKCLADILEAYVGAMFIDSDLNFAEVQRFYNEHMRWYFEDMSIYDSFANNHPVNRLFSLLETTLGCSSYRLMSSALLSPDEYSTTYIAGVVVHETVVANSEGKEGSSKVAKIKAANRATEKLEGLTRGEFVAWTGCGCGGGAAAWGVNGTGDGEATNGDVATKPVVNDVDEEDDRAGTAI